MNDAPTISMTGGYESRGAQFCKYRKPRKVWAEYQAYWAQNHPAVPLPRLHNLPEETGLSEQQLRRLGLKSSETKETKTKSVDTGAQTLVR